MSKILVSISCITYNHEKYIADAIEGFLLQKTDFDYEILIHDDASTDKTADIIRKYEMKYPDLIKPIYQTENQYSKGINPGLLNRERAKGKYIAVCEGDDYWIDPYKLQKQVEYMEDHPECSMCFHDAILVDENKSYLGLFPGHYDRCTGIKNIDELVFIPTASKLQRKSVMNKDNIPNWYYESPYRDFANTLVHSNYGSIYYINEVMSAYRTNVPGSLMYTEKQSARKSPKVKISRLDARIKELENYNKWSNYKNDSAVKKLILNTEFKKYSLERNRAELRKNKYKCIFQNMSSYEILKFYIRLNTPYRLYLILHEIKKRLKSQKKANRKNSLDKHYNFNNIR